MFLVLACQRWGDGFSHVEVLSLPVVSPYEYVVWSVNVCMYVCMSVCDWLRHSSGAHVVFSMLISSSTIQIFPKSLRRKLFINRYI